MQEQHLIPVRELCLHHNVEIKFIQSLEAYGLIELTTVEEHSFLHSSQLTIFEKMIRLHYDLDINLEGIDVIHHLLERLENAQEEICRLRTKLKFYGE
ncbi:MAG TPA: chaperone modulator CbpM [Flavisolibacter sp.]|jgi:hypothetical protein|nr:chaperone modulator CbpM [Flavisolibacter sp.]